MQPASSWRRIQALPALAKAGIVAGGYAVAILLALGVVSIYIDLTSGPQYDRQASSGMFAFADALVFIAVFGMASTVPTALALIFLRRSRGFWIALCVAALAIAGTAVGVVAVTALAPLSTSMWAMLAFPRIFLSPFLGAAFGLAAWAAPEAGFRRCLLAAACVEGVSSIYGFAHWFAPLFLGR